MPSFQQVIFPDPGESNGDPILVRDVMTRNVVTLSPKNTFGEALALMATGSFRHLLIVDEERRLAGVVSDRDLLRVLGAQADPGTEICSGILTREAVTVRPETLLSEAILELLEHRINCLPVLDEEDKVCGIVTTTDLLEELRKAHAEMENRVVERTCQLGIANAELKREISERKRAEEQSREAKEAAQAANQAKSTFLANISHELRTPLHGIISFAKFGLKNTAAAKPEKLASYFQQIEKSGSLLLTLVNGLLDLAKLESGKMSFDFRPVDLNLLVAKVADEFDSLVSERGLKLQCNTPDFKTELALDPDKIMQVVRNLLSNAVKFSPENGKIEIGIDRRDQSVMVSVLDEGVGIPEDELKTIFEQFVQSTKTKEVPGGTGLGLSICSRIIEAHRGRIWAENRPEGGAVFSFEIPVALQGEAGSSPGAATMCQN